MTTFTTLLCTIHNHPDLISITHVGVDGVLDDVHDLVHLGHLQTVPPSYPDLPGQEPEKRVCENGIFSDKMMRTVYYFRWSLLPPADGHGLADPGPLPGEGGHLAPGHHRLHLLPGGGVRPGQRHPLVLVPGVR